MTDARETTGRWSFSAGERGRNRVRAFEHPTTGKLFLEFSEPARQGEHPKVKRVALGHRDRERGKHAAEELAAAIRKGEPPIRAHLTLATLFDNYLLEVTPEKAAQTQRHDRAALALFLRAFGPAREVHTLTRREWDRFIRDRRSGALAHGTPKTPRRPVRNRVISYDLALLVAVLNWATMASDGRGGVLLERNPLKGLPLPKEENPVRERMPEEMYQALRAVAGDVSALFRLAFVLAHDTGHRIGAIRMLRWADVNLETLTIRWREANDKIGFEHTTPLVGESVALLTVAQLTEPGASGEAFVFPDERTPARACPRDRFYDWWLAAERRAGIPHVAHRGWHSLRRKFATELKDTPLKDLCTLGGWKEPTTILTCYQQADDATMRKALEERVPLRQAHASH